MNALWTNEKKQFEAGTVGNSLNKDSFLHRLKQFHSADNHNPVIKQT
jgi:hypothetical protein